MFECICEMTCALSQNVAYKTKLLIFGALTALIKLIINDKLENITYRKFGKNIFEYLPIM